MDVRDVVEKIERINESITILETKASGLGIAETDTVVDLLSEYRSCLYDMKVRP